MASEQNRHILIVGSGSAGKRHARNLAELGCGISCLDLREDRRDELRAETPIIAGYADMAAAMADSGDFDGVVIASPPAFHVEQSLAALEAALPVLLEKPVAPTLADGERLQAACTTSAVPLLLGYTWRWWPPIMEMRRRLDEGAIGRARHVRFVMSANLADWHPWERYQDFFMSQSSLGGGALLDESHWVDLMLWFFGMPAWISADVDRLSELEIDVDDNVDIIAGYPSGLRVTLHLDIYGRPHEKSITATGDNGTLAWRESSNRLSEAHDAGGDWSHSDYDCERNEMFNAVAGEFLSVLDGAAQPGCTIEDGCDVLRVVEAVRCSAAEGRRVNIAAEFA